MSRAASTRHRYVEESSPKDARRGPRGRVVQGRGVEEQLRVGDLVLPVVAEDVLQVADPHVVADDGEVVAAELALGEGEVAGGRAERGDGVEALVDRAPPRLQPGDDGVALTLLVAADGTPDAPRARRVDRHAEQVAAGLGEDLGESDGALELGVRGGVRAARALEEDHRLDRVGVEAGRPGDRSRRPAGSGRRGAPSRGRRPGSARRGDGRARAPRPRRRRPSGPPSRRADRRPPRPSPAARRWRARGVPTARRRRAARGRARVRRRRRSVRRGRWPAGGARGSARDPRLPHGVTPRVAGVVP